MRICALLLLAGCNRLLGLEPTREIDSPPVPDARPDAVGCSGSSFAGTVAVPIDSGQSIYDPTQTDDPLELYFTWAQTTTDFHIASATRGAVDQSFNMPVVLPFSTTHNTDPAITADGLHILYLAQNDQVYQADRATRQSMWSAPTVVAGIDNFTVGGGLDISPDGLTIYFSDGFELRTATRNDPMGPFGTPRVLASGVNATFPGISPDERELFYNPKDSHELRHMTRNDPSLDFDVMTDESLLLNGADPDVSLDSRTLLYDVDGRLTAMHRGCP
jgi:hypothetical protein